MPFPGAVFTSSAAGDIGAGRSYTAIARNGPLLVGTQADSISGGPIPVPGGLGIIQSTQPTTNVVTTAAATIAKASFIYIPQTTASVSTSTFAAGESQPIYSGLGAAMLWDAGSRRLGIYSTASGSGTWFWTNAGITTSAGAGGFTSS